MMTDIDTLTPETFIQKIKATKAYYSNANKEYKVMKANLKTLVLRDQRTKTDFEVAAPAVWSAMFEFGIYDCTVPNMRVYVGKKAAPACAALVFWVFGKGTGRAQIKELADLVFKNIRRRI